MLSQVAYELVEGDYWFGKYGPLKVVIHSKSSYINVSKLCMDGGKRFAHWRENKSSQELIQAVQERISKQLDLFPEQALAGIPASPIFDKMGLCN